MISAFGMTHLNLSDADKAALAARDKRIADLTAEVERVKKDAAANLWTLAGVGIAVVGAISTAFAGPRFLMRVADPDFVYFLETRGRGIFLRAAPVDVSAWTMPTMSAFSRRNSARNRSGSQARPHSTSIRRTCAP